MSKILIINISAHGHINPTLELTTKLVSIGYDVTLRKETWRKIE